MSSALSSRTRRRPPGVSRARRASREPRRSKLSGRFERGERFRIQDARRRPEHAREGDAGGHEPDDTMRAIHAADHAILEVTPPEFHS